jgi:hypothetical protein
MSPDGERVYVRFEEIERATHYGDWFMGQHFDTCLMSPDGGRSWQRTTEAEAPNMDGVELPDGTRLMVTHSIASKRGAELRAYLEEVGMSELWTENAFAWWNIAPPSQKEALQRRGLFVHHVKGGPIELVGYCRDLSVGICPPGGDTWTWTPITGLPEVAELIGWWRQTGVVLEDGAVVGTVHGRDAGVGKDNAYALLSPDRGKTWELHPIAMASGERGFNETFLLTLRDGRILAVLRATEPSHALFSSTSKDGGRTWSTPERTPIQGLTVHLLRLRSGAILCTYTHRLHPRGIRGVLSHDDGATWDVANEIVLRDDAAGSVGYPTSVQLADGTVFTAYELGKPAHSAQAASVQQREASPVGLHQTGTSRVEQLPTGWNVKMNMEGALQAYVAGSRYTEDYVGPVGR